MLGEQCRACEYGNCKCDNNNQKQWYNTLVAKLQSGKQEMMRRHRIARKCEEKMMEEPWMK
jgi:hypothetical protein